MPKQKIVIEYESDEPVFPSEEVTIGKPNRGFDGVSWLQDFLRECSNMHIITPEFIYSNGHYSAKPQAISHLSMTLAELKSKSSPKGKNVV